MTGSRSVCVYVRTDYVCMYHVEQEGRIRDEIDRGTAVFFCFPLPSVSVVGRERV